MVIEVAPSNSFQLFNSLYQTVRRTVSVGIGLGLVAAGAALWVLPGFETETAGVMKAMMGVLLIAIGVSFARVGGASRPVELVFDRTTQEWKMASRKGLRRGFKRQFDRIAPRGSVLTLKGPVAAMSDEQDAPLFDLHLDGHARAVLRQEAARLHATA
ncbi:hypothetical protein [Cognatishimia activa]|uniref:Uncharacterized protein n=1 Tax=Cognatishimia activa TaxID=1715691 RepID=A0A0P1ITM7_9RHOB|nr:hypothetical protein [Cognatishimia activa]CUI80869.1 hypothetical protein TA5113_01539 [Cognatishimia activa]CUK26889.1 hypothetical protein TA5114_02708 [Cognatishimia activa]